MSRNRTPSSPTSGRASPPLRRKVARAEAGDEDAAWAWARSHRARPAAKAPPSVGRAAVKVVRPLEKQLSPAMAELEAGWAEIVGESLARYTRPEKYHGGAGGLTLRIRAKGPAAALAEAQAPRILERAARYSGKHAVKLKIVQGPIQESFAPKPVRRSRITKVARLDEGRKSLDALLEDWAAAVARREGAGALRPRPNDQTDHGKD
ncbi:MAG: DciA family protein [Oceanicaulis sp.]